MGLFRILFGREHQDVALPCPAKGPQGGSVDELDLSLERARVSVRNLALCQEESRGHLEHMDLATKVVRQVSADTIKRMRRGRRDVEQERSKQ
jgi:hypothetical protein